MKKLKKSLYNILKEPFWEGWIIDRGLLVAKLIAKKTGQEYMIWKGNGFILPRLEDRPFSVQERFGSIIYFELENALYLQENKITKEAENKIKNFNKMLQEAIIEMKDLDLIIAKGTEKMGKEAVKEMKKLTKQKDKIEQKIKNVEEKNIFNREIKFKNPDELITFINPTILKQLLQENSIAKITAIEKSWWEDFKVPILIGVIGILIIYFLQIIQKII